MRKTVTKATNQELSNKERSWVNEVKAMEASILATGAPEDGPARLKQTLKRYEEVKRLREDLVEEAKKLGEITGDEDDESLGSSSIDLRIPTDLRRAKINQVKGLLERETALVEAVKSRLERLHVVG